MKFLIVEDDFVCRKILQKFVSQYGECDIAIDGEEALQAYEMSRDDSNAYDAIFLDIQMPKLNGQKVLKRIRESEKKHQISEDHQSKILMTTALSDSKNVMKAVYEGGASGYLTKPITKSHLEIELKKIGLIASKN